MASGSDILDAVRRRLEQKRPEAKESDAKPDVDMEKVASEMLEAMKGGDSKRLARILKAIKEI